MIQHVEKKMNLFLEMFLFAFSQRFQKVTIIHSFPEGLEQFS
jgi:hypothetical protein